MHADCEFCIKRNICTRDVPKPCKYKYTEEERIADRASDGAGVILNATYLPKTYQKETYQKEETKMNATSTENFHDVIAIDFELQTFPNPDENDKFIVSATNRDDIFCFVFEGPYIADACRKAGLFTSWEKDQKIRELENENKQNKEIADTWSKAYYDLSKKFDELKDKKDQKIRELEEENKKLTKAYNSVYESVGKALEEKQQLKKEYEGRIDVLKRKYDLERAANEAQHKFFKKYAGEGTEIDFNYVIDDVGEVSYVIIGKEEYKYLKDNSNRCTMINGRSYTTSEMVDRIVELEELKTPTIENFSDEQPSTRADILDQAKKCVCGQREQDYGTPESNFQLIADLWNGYLGFMDHPQDQIQAKDVAMMMSLMKIARIRNGGGSGDSFVDLAGYAACGGEIWAGEKKQ